MPEEVTRTPARSEAGADKTVECCCPKVVVYGIFAKCVTINNGACEDWDFCQPANITFNKK